MVNLTPEQINDFYDIGFLVVPSVFGTAELTLITDALSRLEKEAKSLDGMVVHRGSQFVVEQKVYEGGTRAQIKRVVWCGAIEPGLLELGEDARITRMAGQIMGCHQVNHLINQVHFKLPHDDVFFPFHQDSLHRGYGTPNWRDVNGRGSYVQVVMAIDPVTIENGPMLFIPGSGRNGHLSLPYDEEVQTVSEHFDPDTAIAVPMNPGDVAVFGPYVIHGSLPNTSDDRRRVFINGFAYPGANSRKYPGEGSGVLINIPER